MKLGIMQPYFMPYIGYYQLIAAVDKFIVYDNIKYTKKGWINRNRLLVNGRDEFFTLPLRGGSDSLDIRDRELAVDFDRDKLLNQLRGAYLRAPYFENTLLLIERIVRYEDTNLFNFLLNSIDKTCTHLGISTSIQVSSNLAIDHELKGQNKVLAICDEVRASTYINSFGGQELYSKENFMERGLNLKFIKAKPLEYPQFGNQFVPWLSIIDVMMFNPIETVRTAIAKNYDLL